MTTKHAETETRVLQLNNSRTREKIPAEWWKKLRPEETLHIQTVVIPTYGDFLSPREREMLRRPDISMKNGVFYRYDDGMKYMGLKPKKLTEIEIEQELVERVTSDRIEELGEIPWWETQGQTREEYFAQAAKEEAERKAEAAKKPRKVTRYMWSLKAKKQYGRRLDASELEDYMYANETEEERLDREYREAMGLDQSSFRPGVSEISDKVVNKYIFCCATAWVFYAYPTVMYAVIVLVICYYILRIFDLYVKFWIAARKPFVADPRSPFTESHQRYLWESDRKYWKLDKEEQKKTK